MPFLAPGSRRADAVTGGRANTDVRERPDRPWKGVWPTAAAPHRRGHPQGGGLGDRKGITRLGPETTNTQVQARKPLPASGSLLVLRGKWIPDHALRAVRDDGLMRSPDGLTGI